MNTTARRDGTPSNTSTPVSRASSGRAKARCVASPGAIRVLDWCDFPATHPVFPESERLIDDARTWLVSYVDRLGGGERLRRPIDQSLSMCSFLFPEATYDGIF